MIPEDDTGWMWSCGVELACSVYGKYLIEPVGRGMMELPLSAPEHPGGATYHCWLSGIDSQDFTDVGRALKLVIQHSSSTEQ